MSTISIFIRARNEAESLERTLLTIRRQSRLPDEVVLLDNESDDETGLVAKRFGASVQSIQREEFTYGRALNRALQHTSGDVIVYLSAHSPAVNEQWLGNLVEPIEREGVDATFGRQVPEPDVNYLEEWFLYRTFPSRPNRLKAMMSLQKVTFSNANAAVQRHLIEKHPFREDLAFAEDIEWAQRVGEKGYRMSYRPEASVFHSHRFGPGDLEGRMVAAGRSMGQCGQGRVYKHPISCLAAYFAAITVDAIYCLTKGYWSTIHQIPRYRKEYFRGLRKGLTPSLRP